jgi:hypothetical protein
MKNKKLDREKPRMCDPYMCESCEDGGDGNFVCTYDPKKPLGVLVVHNWNVTNDHLWCKRRKRQNYQK